MKNIKTYISFITDCEISYVTCYDYPETEEDLEVIKNKLKEMVNASSTAYTPTKEITILGWNKLDYKS